MATTLKNIVDLREEGVDICFEMYSKIDSSPNEARRYNVNVIGSKSSDIYVLFLRKVAQTFAHVGFFACNGKTRRNHTLVSWVFFHSHPVWRMKQRAYSRTVEQDISAVRIGALGMVDPQALNEFNAQVP